MTSSSVRPASSNSQIPEALSLKVNNPSRSPTPPRTGITMVSPATSRVTTVVLRMYFMLRCFQTLKKQARMGGQVRLARRGAEVKGEYQFETGHLFGLPLHLWREFPLTPAPTSQIGNKMPTDRHSFW